MHATYKGYVGSAAWDMEAGAYHGRVLGLRDVITFRGRSEAEAREAFEASVDDYLAFCKARGEAPESPLRRGPGEEG